MMGWLGNLILKVARKGSPVRETIEDVGEAVLPKALVDAVEVVDKIGADTVIEKQLRGKPKRTSRGNRV